MKTYNKRPLYMDKIRPYIDTDIIKVLLGQRRVGKSYILFQIMDELAQVRGIDPRDIIYINKELNEFDNIRDYNDLLVYIKSHANHPWMKKYIFIDEVQDILQFEKALRDLYALGWYDIYISGSNAHMLSSDIATFLTGRYIEFEIFPLSYSEFLDFHRLPQGKESFLSFMRYGGLPYLKHITLSDEVVYDYLKSVYNTIALRDIVQRYSIRNVDFLDRLTRYLAEHIGGLFTAHNISRYLKSQQVDIGTNVVLEYLSHMTSVYLVNQVQRQEIVGKKIFEINDKYYFSDIGIRNMLIGGYRQADIWKIMENIVWLHFRSRGYQVYIGKLGVKEIDFVVYRGSDIKYIQVCYLIESEETRNREFGNLLDISDNYEKIVLSLDDFVSWDFLGIKHYNLIEYLTWE